MTDTPKLALPKDLGGYRLLEHLADGRLGEVYRARRTQCLGEFAKPFAVKRFNRLFTQSPSFARQLIESIAKASAVTDRTIAQTFDLSVEKERYYLASEFLDGCDLGVVCNTARTLKTPFPPLQGAFILAEVARALAHAVAQDPPIVHGHLTPGNIRLTLGGEVKVTDFGLSAPLYALPPGMYSPTQQDLRYVAPEVARGRRPDAGSDLYSLAVILYELLAASHPFDFVPGTSAATLATTGVPKPIGAVASLPGELEALLNRLLDPDPATRLRSAAEVHRETCGFLDRHGLARADPLLAQVATELRGQLDSDEAEQDEQGRETRVTAVMSTTLGSPADRARRRILVADDSRTIRKAYDITFALEEIALIHATDGEEAVRLARTERPDIAIVDHHMPGASGYDVLARLKDDPRLRHIPVVICASEQTPFDPARGARSAAQLTKPFDTQEVLDLTRKLLGADEADEAAPQ